MQTKVPSGIKKPKTKTLLNSLNRQTPLDLNSNLGQKPGEICYLGTARGVAKPGLPTPGNLRPVNLAYYSTYLPTQ